jgi:hypothetical protein
VELLHGDSAELLPGVVEGLTEPALFWLDGHFSDGATALGSSTTPIMAELGPILDSALPHAVLVDDARLFDGTDGYPELADVRSLVTERRPDLSWSVEDDIVRIEPTSAARRSAH